MSRLKFATKRVHIKNVDQREEERTSLLSPLTLLQRTHRCDQLSGISVTLSHELWK